MSSQTSQPLSSVQATNRGAVLRAIRDIMSDGRRRRTREICETLGKCGLHVTKELVSSILHREGRALFLYDSVTYEHWLPRTSDVQSVSEPVSNRAQPSRNGNGTGVSSLNALMVDDGAQFRFKTAEFASDAFVVLQPEGNTTAIVINRTHPSYEQLSEIFVEHPDQLDRTELLEHFSNAREGLMQLLIAWARYETCQPEGVLQNRAQDARHDWGRIVRGMMRSRSKQKEVSVNDKEGFQTS